MGPVLATLATLAALAWELFDARRAGEMLGGGAAIGDLIFCARRARSAYEAGAAIGITEEMADDSISATIPNQRIIPTHLDTHKNCRRKLKKAFHICTVTFISLRMDLLFQMVDNTIVSKLKPRFALITINSTRR